MTFDEIKSELLALAKVPAQNGTCTEYRRALHAENMEALSACIRDNFLWCCDHKVLTVDTITRWGLKAHGITANEDVHDACCLAYDSSTVTATGSSTVRAYGSSTVRAYGSSTVRAYDSSTVTAYGSSTVTAYGSSTVRAYGSSTVRAYDSSTVRAYGSSYVNSTSTIECKVEANAVLRRQGKIITPCGVIAFQ